MLFKWIKLKKMNKKLNWINQIKLKQTNKKMNLNELNKN